MRKIINWSLLLGTMISILVVLKFSSLPVPEFVPYKISEIWIVSAEEQQKYALLYDIANGFIISAFFYFLIEEIPDRIRRRRAKELIHEDINWLLEYMEQIISIIIAKYHLNLNLKELARKDFFVLDGDADISNEEISYLTITYYVKHKKQKNSTHSYGTVSKLLKDNLKKIIDKLASINNYEYFYVSDSHLISCLRGIAGCKLIRIYFHQSDSKISFLPFLSHDTSDAMAEFVDLYMQLIKLKIHTEYTQTTLDDKKETIKYHKERECGKYFQDVLDIQKEWKRITDKNPTVVISSRKYTTDILVNRLKRRLQATYYSVDSIHGKNLDEFKCFVFIVDSISKKEIIHFLKESNIQEKIVLLTERNFSTGIKKEIERNETKIECELFFYSCFKNKYLPFVFYKEEPSEKNIALIASKIETIFYGKHR